MDKIWLKNYPKEVPHTVNPNELSSTIHVLDESIKKYKNQIAFTNMGKSITYSELDELSGNFASFLQNELGLIKGDRIAIQMPNLLQFPIALFGAHKAGLIVVNTNPLYTAREMEHQFKDADVKAIVILENYAHLLESILNDVPIKHIILTEIGDLLPFPKNMVVNSVVKYVKKMVPPHKLQNYYSFNRALDIGANKAYNEVPLKQNDTAFLQYTGGTTGVSKGAVLTHGNIIANMSQIYAWMLPTLIPGKEIIVTALPMYHIFSLTVNCFSFIRYGAQNILITNPKDIPGFIGELKKYPFSVLTGVNTLFNALMNHKDFGTIDFSKTKVSVAGGMALQTSVALKWKELTKSIIVEGYGLTETSPVLCCNPINGTERVGTIGLPLPNTEIKLLSDDGIEQGIGEVGEICAKGPQVMKEYWNKPQETANIFTKDGWIKTGDVATVDADGFFKIVDRKKDMILVSGFNVYPNEIEDVIASHPGVLEVAAIGVPDERSGEVVKIFVVKKDPELTVEELSKFARSKLTGYKSPKYIEFKSELPKTNVGKILRRALRDSK